jgi:hypothetical protein
VISDPHSTHSELTGDSSVTRIAPTHNTAATPATAAAQRIAIFQSIWRGRGGGSAPVLADVSAAASPPVSGDW